MDNFLFDSVAWHIHINKRFGECGFEALGKVLDILCGRHQTHTGFVIYQYDCVLPLIDDVFCVPVTERRCGRDGLLGLQHCWVQFELLQDLLCAAQLYHKTRPPTGFVVNVASA